MLFRSLGVRKFDLPAAWARLLRGRSDSAAPQDPREKFAGLLAAGNIEGLRPLRYEKRVARNRFIALSLLLLALVWGLASILVRR